MPRAPPRPHTSSPPSGAGPAADEAAAAGDREEADAHGAARGTTVAAASQPVPHRRRFLPRLTPGVPQDWEWPANCVKIAVSTYNSSNARSMNPRLRPRRISSKLPRVGPLLAAALGALQQCWFRRSAAARVSASSGVEHHHWACRRRAGGTHADPRRAELDDRTQRPDSQGALRGARCVLSSRSSVERMHRCSGSSVRSLQAYTRNVASIRVRETSRLVALRTLAGLADWILQLICTRQLICARNRARAFSQRQAARTSRDATPPRRPTHQTSKSLALTPAQ